MTRSKESRNNAPARDLEFQVYRVLHAHDRQNDEQENRNSVEYSVRLHVTAETGKMRSVAVGGRFIERGGILLHRVVTEGGPFPRIPNATA